MRSFGGRNNKKLLDDVEAMSDWLESGMVFLVKFFTFLDALFTSQEFVVMNGIEVYEDTKS